MNQAEVIISKFGGLSALARELGNIPVSTVQGWKERGIIPAKRQGAVLAAARRCGIALEASDFITIDAPAPAAASAAA